MKTLTLVTPTVEARYPLLRETFDSVVNQTWPTGWALEWLIQVDSVEVPERLRTLEHDTPWVKIEANGVQQGAAGTRNLALGRANGSWFRNLDDDDLLPPGVLDELVRTVGICETRDLAFFTGRLLDLLDGELVEFPEVMPRGAVEPGVLFEAWRERGWLGVVHPTSLCARVDAALAVGGYAAVLGSEDTALLMALNAVFRGYHTDSVVLHYRKHPDQLTATSWATSPEYARKRYGWIEARTRALRDLWGHGR